jgi:hypothetical protein
MEKNLMLKKKKKRKEKKPLSRVPVILDTQEAEIRRTVV